MPNYFIIYIMKIFPYLSEQLFAQDVYGYQTGHQNKAYIGFQH